MLELWDHQKEAVKFGMDKTSALYLFQVGTGKTPIAINLIRFRSAQHGRLLRTLILGPIAILQQFKDEFSKFSKITPDKITVLKGTGKKKTEQVNSFHGKDQIIITNYESLLNADLFAALMAWGPELLVGDEIHQNKNPKAKRAKATAKLAQKCLYKYGLTGTGILQGPQDLYMLFNVLDQGETFGNNFFAFRGKYMIDENAAWSGRQGHFPKWIPNPSMFEELNRKIYTIATKKTKEECIDLPEYIQKTIYIDMPADMKKLYDQMERDFIIFLEENKDSNKSGAVVANLAVTKAMKMLQIISGFAIDEEGETISLKTNPKLTELENLLDKTRGSKVIVWACFKQNHKDIEKLCEKLCKKMKLKSVLINGDVTAKEKHKRITQFQEDPETTVFISSQGAGGTGINLQQAGYSIYFSKNANLGHDIQSAGRNFRGGSVNFHKSVTRIDLVMRNTIDEIIDMSLAKKQEVSDIILNYKDMVK